MYTQGLASAEDMKKCIVLLCIVGVCLGRPQYQSGSYGSSSSQYSSSSSQYGSALRSSQTGSGYSAGGSGGYGSVIAGRSGFAGGYGGSQYGRQGNSDDLSEPARYEFKYDVNEPDYGVEFGHQEQRDGDNTSGAFYVLLPDGRRQLVEYTADADGFHPKISYQETGAGGRSGNYGAAGNQSGAYGNASGRSGQSGYQSGRQSNYAGSSARSQNSGYQSSGSGY